MNAKVVFAIVAFLALGQVTQAQVKFRKIGSTNYFQLGLQETTSLTLGTTNGLEGPQANWGLENWDGGLNFWKPWPSAYYGNYHLFIADNGNVGIGRKPENFKLDVDGTIRGTDIYANVLYGYSAHFTGPLILVNQTVVFSDERLKSNIKPLNNSLEKLLLLNGKSYNKTSGDFSKEAITALRTSSTTNTSTTNNSTSVDGLDETKRKTVEADKKREEERKAEEEALKQKYAGQSKVELGLLAQEVQKVFPELVHETENGLLAINYDGLIPVIIEALKEQNEQIEVLKALNKGNTGNNGSSNKRTSSKTETTPNTNPLEIESIVLNSKLEQNNPNPFSASTQIKYNIPLEVNQAFLYVYDLNGTQKKAYNITQKGEGSITIQGSELSPGMYLYTLVVDGSEVDTKRMILTAE